MAILDIINAIEDKAKSEIAQLDQEQKKQLKEATKSWDNKIAAKKEELLEQTHQKIDQKVRQNSFQLKAQARNKVSARKKQIIEEITENALSELNDYSDEQKEKLFTDLLSKVDLETAVIHCHQDDEKALKSALKNNEQSFEIKTDLKERGFSLSGNHLEINFTLSSLAKRAAENSLAQINQALFN